MDFRVVIKTGNPDIDTDLVLEQYSDVLGLIDSQMAYWNNFYPNLEFKVIVTKIKSQTDTIGVNVDEDLKITEHLN